MLRNTDSNSPQGVPFDPRLEQGLNEIKAQLEKEQLWKPMSTPASDTLIPASSKQIINKVEAKMNVAVSGNGDEAITFTFGGEGGITTSFPDGRGQEGMVPIIAYLQGQIDMALFVYLGKADSAESK